MSQTNIRDIVHRGSLNIRVVAIAVQLDVAVIFMTRKHLERRLLPLSGERRARSA